MKTKVLMVCLGNICRSPLAQGVLEQKVNPKNVWVDSAGTGGYHIGEAPDSRSIDVAKKYGIDISSQRCRKFNPDDFEAFDKIYVMDFSNLENIKTLARNQEDLNKVSLLLNDREVPDPYYGGANGFELIYRLIDQACESIANELQS
jgi:protein-tyrosine phosphatase